MTPSPRAAPGSDCPNEVKASADPSLRRSPPFDGDVDGDGASDRVFIAADESAAPECSAFVVALTRSARLSAPVFQPGFEPSLNLPALRFLTPLDARPGAEVVVDVAAGASTVFAAAFTVNDGRLRRLAVRGDDPALDDLFAYGSSAGHTNGADCEKGLVVVSDAVPVGGRWRVRRKFFRRAEGSLEILRERSENLVVSSAGMRALPEFSGRPFSRCG